MRLNSFVALSSRRLYDISLTYESDTLCRWLDPFSHAVNFTLCRKEQEWWFSEENDVKLSAQRFYPNQLYPIVYHGEPCLLLATKSDPKQATSQYVASYSVFPFWLFIVMVQHR